MSIVNIAACYDLRAALEYQEGDNNERIAVCASNIEPFDFDEYTRLILENGSHKVQGYTIIQSFSLEELQNTQSNAELANVLGCALIEAAYPNCAYKVITHRDSKTGHLHNHCSVLNYEFETNKAITQNRRWLDLSRLNDSIMEQNGMEVCDAKTRQADQKQYWDKKRNPEKYVWQDDLESRIHKALNNATSVKEFAAHLAAEGVTARLFDKNGKELKHMSFSFVGNDGATHRKRGDKMSIPSTKKELVAVFNENAAKAKQLAQQSIVAEQTDTSSIFVKAQISSQTQPKQQTQEQANIEAEAAEIAKQKAKAEAEEKERRKAEQIRLSQQKERERIQQREKLKQQLLTDSKTYNELENYDDLSANEQDRLDDEERKRQIRLQKIYAEEAIEKADARRASAQLDKKLEYAYNVSKQKQHNNDGYSL